MNIFGKPFDYKPFTVTQNDPDNGQLFCGNCQTEQKKGDTVVYDGEKYTCPHCGNNVPNETGEYQECCI